jgi:hypothetical protein
MLNHLSRRRKTMTHTLPQTAAPYTPKAFYATYEVRTAEGATAHYGVALRTCDGRCFFRYEPTGLWTELGNHAVPALILHGECALVDEAKHWDQLHADIYCPRSRTAYPRLAA